MNKPWKGLPIVILGTGGISKETKLVIDEINTICPFTYNFVGFITDDPSRVNQPFYNNTIIGIDESISLLAKKYYPLGVVIPFGNPELKFKIASKYSEIENIVFPNIIHPTVTISDSIRKTLGIGNIITEGVRFTVDVLIGNFNLFNLNCTIGHDSIIGNYNVINPGVTISGNVKLEDRILLGTGVNVNQGLSITNNVIIGSGAVVQKDINENGVYVGIPAKRIK